MADALIKEDLRRFGHYLEMEELDGCHIFRMEWLCDTQRLGHLEENSLGGTERKRVHSALDSRLLKVSIKLMTRSILEAEQERDLETGRKIRARDIGLSLWSISQTIWGDCWQTGKESKEEN